MPPLSFALTSLKLIDICFQSQLDDENDVDFILNDPADYVVSNPEQSPYAGSGDQGGITPHNMEGVHQAKGEGEKVKVSVSPENSAGDVVPDIILHSPSSSANPTNQIEMRPQEKGGSGDLNQV